MATKQTADAPIRMDADSMTSQQGAATAVLHASPETTTSQQRLGESARNRLPVQILHSVFEGKHWRVLAQTRDGQKVSFLHEEHLPSGGQGELQIPPSEAFLYPFSHERQIINMSRILVISDIHGHVDGARLLLKLAAYEPGKDELILLGDFIDMDPATWGALSFIRSLTEQGAIAIAGNMERMLLREAASRQGGMTAEFTANIDFVSKLPLYYVKSPYLFVHAGLRPGVPLEEQTPDDLTTIRDEFWRGEPFGLPYTIIFGHTPTQRLGAPPGAPWFSPGRLGIDTGAKHGLRLSLLDLTEQTLYSCSTSPATLYLDARKTEVRAHFAKRRRNHDVYENQQP
ncbi:metallophosphoesterase [Paenibacillus hexagrammi]|uniref:Metallophosphoesterase n=1 Tax=Paenibacillus hexagrammi TaxID=2908839 RepID=A0ABY3SLE7_9BACL|nr:metallophosphoesterase [Paenibacillus sp. YPD9-1]UJF34011.1 metallophosphoesterase [Paenibacillus sp. YPD9-1]